MKKSELYSHIGDPEARYFNYVGKQPICVSMEQQNFFYNSCVCCAQVSRIENLLVLIFHEWDALYQELKEIGKPIYRDNGYNFHIIQEEDISLLGEEGEPFGFFPSRERARKYREEHSIH